MPDNHVGKVFLVGAGPGDPDLITLRAVECLKLADLVLYDGLVNPLLLRHAAGECRRTARVRRDGMCTVPQQEINELLIREAAAGKTVIRLKSGDPCIFGRGGEEIHALQQAGIPFEVVPGITAASAAAEYAGIGLTHRGISSAVAFVTGHEVAGHATESGGTDSPNYSTLAAFPGTLVFYMGLSRLPLICEQLMKAGKPAMTPAAVICQATLPAQQVVTGTLGDLPELAAAAGLQPPSLIVVGDCVRLRDRPSWFEQLSLFGTSIGITRPVDQAQSVVERIIRLGGEPVLMPLIGIGEIDSVAAGQLRSRLNQLAGYRWLIFTSVNGVTHFFRHLANAGLDARALGGARIAAIGSSTADALASHQLRADLVPEEYRAESLAAALSPSISGHRCLWLRASRGRDVLPTMLAAAGAVVDEWVVYENRDCTGVDDSIVSRITSGRLDWIGVSSPSIALQLARLFRDQHLTLDTVPTRLASISPVTSAAMCEQGLIVSAEARQFTWDGILQSVIEWKSGGTVSITGN